MRLAMVVIVAVGVAAAGGQRLPQLMKGVSFKHSQVFAQLGGSPVIPRVRYNGDLELRPTDLGVVTLMGDIALTLTAEGELTISYEFADEDGGKEGEEKINIVLVEAPNGKIIIFDHTRETEIGEGTLDDKRISLHFSWPEKLILGWIKISGTEVDELGVLLMKKDSGNFDFNLESPKSYHWGLGELHSSTTSTQKR